MRTLQFACIFCLFGPLLGCSQLALNPFSSEGSVPPVAVANSVGECEVEFKPASGKGNLARVALQADSTVQYVLSRSEGQKKFARMELELVRKLPTGGEHRMQIDYDRAARRVDSGTDYHVQPGDRLVITEDTSTILDDMLESALGSWATSGKKK